jgi:zinc D-Ala-D-Ala carboxypeptidase
MTWAALNFTPREFACRCGRPNCTPISISPKLVAMLDIARTAAGIPFIITSGVRCRNHNDTVGGALTSSHLTGLAADIRCYSGADRLVIVRALLAAGFERVGIAHGFVHVDVDQNKTKSIWVY